MPIEIKCKKDRDELYWRERCIDIMFLRIPAEYREKVTERYLEIFRETFEKTWSHIKAYDEVFKRLSKEFDIKIIIEDGNNEH